EGCPGANCVDRLVQQEAELAKQATKLIIIEKRRDASRQQSLPARKASNDGATRVVRAIPCGAVEILNEASEQPLQFGPHEAQDNRPCAALPQPHFDGD